MLSLTGLRCKKKDLQCNMKLQLQNIHNLFTFLQYIKDVSVISKHSKILLTQQK